MSAYWAIFSARFRVLLQYRAAALAGAGTQFFWGIMKCMILTAFYASSSAPQPMALSEAIAYIWLGQSFLLFFPWNVDNEVARMVKSGDLCYELVRPLDTYWLWFSRVASMRTAPVLLRCLPILIISGLFFGLMPPPSVYSALAFLGAIIGALLLSCAITVLIMTSFFWTISGEGMLRLFPAFMLLTAGLIVPLPFFPDVVQPILSVLPFRGIIDVPFRLYMGHISPDKAPLLILQQFVWSAILIIIGRTVLKMGLKRTVIQGG